MNYLDLGVHMKTIKTIFILCMIAVTSVSLFAKVEQWKNFSNHTLAKTPDSLSHIIVLRSDALRGQAINIYVDGEYVSSLLSGAYTQELVCPGNHRLNLAYTNAKTRYSEKRKGGQKATFDAGEKYVFRMVKQGNRLALHPLSKEEAVVELKKHTKKQSHTISRLNKRKCTQSAQNKRK